jgi:colicin import membrane protein
MNWIAPASMTAGWSCEIMVEQNRFGEVQNVRAKQCSGSEAFKSTVERAVRKASPLPEAPNNDVFDKKINFIFKPEV